LGGLEATNQLDQFRDYWTAKSGANSTKVLWGATWRNWVRNSNGRRKPNGQDNRTGWQKRKDEYFTALDKLEAAANGIPPDRNSPLAAVFWGSRDRRNLFDSDLLGDEHIPS